MGVIIKEPLANGRLTARGDVADLADAASAAGTTPTRWHSPSCLPNRGRTLS